MCIRDSSDGDAPPIATIEKLTIQGAYWEFFRIPKRVRRVRIEGLRMFVSSGSERIENAARPGSPEQSGLIVDQIIADGAVLEFSSGQSGKEPLKFEIHKLTLNSVADDRPLSFLSLIHISARSAMFSFSVCLPFTARSEKGL